MNYYLVKCKFGHVGRDKYLPLTIALIAESAKKASQIARKIGGVKRNHKDWCLEGPYEVNFNEYEEAKKAYKNDIYFEKHSRSRLDLFKDRLIDETNYSRINGIKTNTKNYKKSRDSELIEFKLKKEKVVIKSLMDYQRSQLSSTYSSSFRL